MSAATNYLEGALLDHVLRGHATGTDYTQPTNVYLGLVTDTATDTELEEGTLTNEITGYTGDRPVVEFTEPIVIANGDSQIENTIEIAFEDMPEATIGYLIITDSPTKGSGNVLYYSQPDSIKTSNAGDTYRILVGDLTVDLG